MITTHDYYPMIAARCWMLATDDCDEAKVLTSQQPLPHKVEQLS
jgi:hypothetical protein